MRKLTKFAAAAALALPLLGFASTSAEAADVSFGLTVVSPGADYVRYRGEGYRGGHYGRDRYMPAHVVRRDLERAYRRVDTFDRSGSLYVARVQDWNGRTLRVAVSAYDGRVVESDYIRWNGYEWKRVERWNERRADWRDRDDRRDRDDHRRDDGWRNGGYDDYRD
ncbi:MAG: hypothetical protein IT548_09385 [Alphaproteobacteria bacterium]|nr:hypothetical protein [Alphaproteobacteria bacterium]